MGKMFEILNRFPPIAISKFRISPARQMELVSTIQNKNGQGSHYRMANFTCAFTNHIHVEFSINYHAQHLCASDDQCHDWVLLIHHDRSLTRIREIYWACQLLLLLENCHYRLGKPWH